ncbi:MAG: hypothetical protein JWO87_444 [Phycisphaerales bacterium]|nr:hypothetical protein [Phycisphaerales bacterium]
MENSGWTMRQPALPSSILYLLSSLFFLPGCGAPNQENIRLRKLNQDLQAKLEQCHTQVESDKQTIAGLVRRSPIIPMLPPEELEKLWVTHGLKFGRFTGGYQIDRGKPGDQGVQVYIVPADENAMSIQAAGSFVVEAFDLADPHDTRLGRWTWDTVQAKKEWREFLVDYTYVLKCPWQRVPAHPDVTIRVTFTDELTHIPYSAEHVVHVKPPPPSATQPAAR